MCPKEYFHYTMRPKRTTVNPMNIMTMLEEMKKNSDIVIDVLKVHGLPSEDEHYNHQSLLDAAIKNKNFKVVNLLFHKGCLLTVKSLNRAIEMNSQPIANTILYNRPELIDGDENEDRPLIYAVKKKAKPLIQLLLRKGANYNATDKMGNTVLHIAVEDEENSKKYPYLTVISILKNFSHMPINIKNNDGETPLHVAAKSKNKEIVEFLLNNNADLKACDKYGNTILHIVIKHNSHDSFEFSEYNPKYEHFLRVKRENKKTAEFVKWLISKGVNFELLNNEGKTPLYYAVIYRKTAVVTALLKLTTKITDADNKNGIFEIFLKTYLQENIPASGEIISIVIQFLEKGVALDDGFIHEDPFAIVTRYNQTVIEDIMMEHSKRMHPYTEDHIINSQNSIKEGLNGNGI